MRFLVNPYFRNAESGAEIVTDEWLLEKAQSLAKMIINREIGDEEMAEAGPYTGLSGIALALFKGIDLPEHDTIEIGRKYLHDCLRLNEHKKSQECRYLCGELGTLTVLLEDPLANRNELEKRIERIGWKLAEPSYLWNEILVGRAGFLASVLRIRQRVDPDLVSDKVITAVLISMVNAGRSYSLHHKSPCPLMFEYHGTEYIGAAHGLAGILQMMLSFSHLLSEDAQREVKQSADFVLSIQDETGNFPSSMKHVGEMRAEPLIHWCHGAPGVIYLCFTMWKKYGNEQYLQAAIKCGELIWERGVLKKGPGLCHGVSGNGYALLVLWRTTKNPVWLSRARVFARLMLDENIIKQQSVPDAPFSLFEGWAGGLYFLLDLLEINRDTAQFPLFPLAF